jgi:GNAT superfamily N-acetyltransferase
MPLTPNPVLQAATHQDVEALLVMMEALYANEGHSFDAALAERATRNLLDSPMWGHIWLIQRDGRPVGYVVLTFGFSLEFGGRDALLDELFILEPYRSQGLGRQALQFVFDQCRREEIRALHLEVLLGNDKAAAIYSRFGFEPDTRQLMTKWLG